MHQAPRHERVMACRLWTWLVIAWLCAGVSRAREASGLGVILSRYLTNEELADHMLDYTRRCSSISKLHEIGKSVGGTPILALELSKSAGKDDGRPHFKYVANIHGDEPTGRVFTLALAEHICEKYGADDTARRLVEDLHLWLVPTLNPDGFAARSRENSHKQDLNRNFPDRFSSVGMTITGKEEPEVQAMANWTLGHAFTASAAMHEGAVVANYPWDGSDDRKTRYVASPDDATFKHLASVYAKAHKDMALPSNKEFPNGGITNGAAWYPIYGSMQDWNYIVAGCFELTLELSQRKWPPTNTLPQLWETNREALINLPLVALLGGVRGVVWGENPLRSGGIASRIKANVTVEGIKTLVQSQLPFGTFYRPLAPGKYKVRASAQGYSSSVIEAEVPADGSGTYLEFTLDRATAAEQLAEGADGTVSSNDQIPGLIMAQQTSPHVDGQPSRIHPVLALACLGLAFWFVWIVGWRYANTRRRRKLVNP